jgi:WD40 repeat protein
VIPGHMGHVDAVAFSPDGKMIATGSDDGTGRLWTSDGKFIGPLIGHTGKVTAVAFNPQSNLVATASRDSTVRVWKVSLGQLPLVLRGHTGAVTRVRFTPDGSRIVTVSTDGTERTWDPEPEPLMHPIQGGQRIRPSRVAEAAGKRATVDGDQVILDDLDTGEQSRLVGQFGTINGVGISPDGRWVVTAGPFSAGLWRSSSTGIHTYLRETDRPVAAEFTSDRRIITLARDGKMREWICDYCGSLDELIHTAKARLAATGRTFTRAERARFLSN